MLPTVHFNMGGIPTCWKTQMLKGECDTVVPGLLAAEPYEPSMMAVTCVAFITNGLASMVKAIQDALGIKRGLLTTGHAMKVSHPSVDGSSMRDWRGGSAAPGNIVSVTYPQNSSNSQQVINNLDEPHHQRSNLGHLGGGTAGKMDSIGSTIGSLSAPIDGKDAEQNHRQP